MAGSVLLANGAIWAGLARRAGLLSEETMATVTGFYGSEYDFLRAFFILLVGSALWVGVAYLTPPDPDDHLERFYRKVRPGGWWGPIAARCADVPTDLMPAWRRWLGWGAGLVFLYGCVAGIGHVLTGRAASGSAILLLGLVSGFFTLSLATERGTPSTSRSG